MFQVGDRVRMTQLGINNYGDQAGGTTGTVLGQTIDGDPKWTDVRWDNGHSNNYELDEIFVTVRTTPEKVEEQKEATPRVKYLYSVQTEDGNPLLNTRDREYAREFKTQLGGKKEGIIIMAYAPVKEIR